MATVVLAALAAGGVFYLYTAVVLRWRQLRPMPALRTAHPRRTGRDWLNQAGLAEVGVTQLASVSGMILVGTAALVFVVFGAPVPSVAAGLFAATAPVASARVRRDRRRTAAQDAWPRMIEELRIQTGALGRSVPQGLFEVGRRAPAELRGAFEAAHREWLISTDFERATDVLRSLLADPTADVVCETLLVAHAVGGRELDARLAALVEDRIQDTNGRKDARARQSGARFARRFVLVVPVGMALAGMSVGDGRVAYRTPTGQLLTTVAIALVGACWLWAGRIMRLPTEARVFAG